MKCTLGKNGGYKFNGLDNRLVVVIRQADSETKFLHFTKFLIQQPHYNAYIARLFQ